MSSQPLIRIKKSPRRGVEVKYIENDHRSTLDFIAYSLCIFRFSPPARRV